MKASIDGEDGGEIERSGEGRKRGGGLIKRLEKSRQRWRSFYTTLAGSCDGSSSDAIQIVDDPLSPYCPLKIILEAEKGKKKSGVILLLSFLQSLPVTIEALIVPVRIRWPSATEAYKYHQTKWERL